MSTVKKESLFALAVLSLTVLFWGQTNSMPGSAAMFPRLLMGGIALLTTLMIIQAVRRGEDKPGPPVYIPRVAAFLTLLLVYVGCADSVGYFIVTPLFVMASSFLLRAMSLRSTLFMALGFPAFIYGLFVGFLHLPVPLGLLENLLGG